MTIKPSSNFSAPSDIEGLVARLEDWQTNLRQSRLKQRVNLADAIKVDQHLLGDVRKLHLTGQLDDLDTVAEMIKVIKQWFKAAPVIHISFPTPPAPKIQSDIIEWLHAHIAPSLLVQVQVDSGIAAGFVVRTRNRVLDFTANQVLWQNRHIIPELTRRV